MTGQRRLATACAVAVLALTGCTDDPAPAAAPAATSAAIPTPPAPPPDGGPVLRLLASADLSAGLPGEAASVASAVATPDGGALVALTPVDGTGPLALVTVDPAGALVRSVPAPALAQVFGVHLLADGEVLVSGQFPRPGRDYGFAAVDPVSGAARTVVAVRYEEGTAFSFGRSTLSADGSRLFLFVATAVDIRNLDLLVAVDPLTGEFLGGRDLFEEVRQISGFPVATHASGLLPRPDGGVTLAFDAWEPPGAGERPVPGLLNYTADLEPAGDPVHLDVGGAMADVQAAATDAAGTVYLTLQPRDGDVLATVRGRSADVVPLGGHSYDDWLVVDPAAGEAVVPSRTGARAVDLATGAVGRVDVDCPTVQPVWSVLPGAGPTRALLTGRCDRPAPGTPMLWLVGP